MTISIEKTKTMIIGNTATTLQVQIENQVLEQVPCFKYLGVTVNSAGNLSDEIRERQGKTGRLFNAISKKFFGKKEIPKPVKAEVVKKVAVPIFTYGAEPWTLTEPLKSKITY